MSKSLNLKNSRRDGGLGKGGAASTSLIKPVIALVLLVGIAIAVAALLARRNQRDVPNSDPARSSALNFKPIVTSKGWSKGNMAAKTVLVEFADFQCGACAAASQTVANVLKKQGSNLLVVFKQFPMERVHRNSMIAAQAAEAAGRQSKFWEMHDLLFLRQREWAEIPDAQTFFLNYAAELHLDLEKFKQDLWDGQVRDKIFRDILEGQLASVNSTPALFLNGSRMPRAQSDAHFEEMIADAMKTGK